MTPYRGSPVAVLAHAVHVPGADAWSTAGAAVPDEPMVGPDEARQVLGRKGLLGKEPATRLALIAVHRALGLPPGPPAEPPPAAGRTAVVVSSNLGNLATVCEIAAAVRVEGYRTVSPMQTPNVSSNVIASAIAIRYGFTGPNVMLCNGATSGLDAVRVGVRLIRAGRAERVVVVGAEPDDAVAQTLAKSRGTAGPDAGAGAPALRAAAACVILGAPPRQDRDRRTVLVDPGAMLRPSAGRDEITPPGFAGLMFVPYAMAGRPGAAPAAGADDRVVDLTERLGDTYGALGVLQTAAAAARLAAPGAPDTAHVACGDATDGYAWLSLSARGVR